MKTLAEMGDAARRCSNLEYQAAMRRAVVYVSNAASALAADPNELTLRALNGAWANAARIYKNIPPEASPSPTSGSAEPARLAA